MTIIEDFDELTRRRKALKERIVEICNRKRELARELFDTLDEAEKERIMSEYANLDTELAMMPELLAELEKRYTLVRLAKIETEIREAQKEAAKAREKLAAIPNLIENRKKREQANQVLENTINRLQGLFVLAQANYLIDFKSHLQKIEALPEGDLRRISYDHNFHQLWRDAAQIASDRGRQLVYDMIATQRSRN